MNWVKSLGRRFERPQLQLTRRQMWATFAGLLGFLALSARFGLWSMLGLVTLGTIAGVGSVVGWRAVRRRVRGGANANRRLGDLESLAVERQPFHSDASQPSQRVVIPSRRGIGLAERVASVKDHGEVRDPIDGHTPVRDDVEGSVEDPPASNSLPDDTVDAASDSTDSKSGAALVAPIVGDPDSAADDIHSPVSESSVTVESPVSVEETAQRPVDSSEEDSQGLVGMTADEMAALFNRYEVLARNDLESLTDDESAIGAEIWLDLTQGEAWFCIDTTRTSAAGRWVYLDSGEIICKPRGSDVWTRVDGRKRGRQETAAPVSPVGDREPAELTFVIVRDA